MHGIPRTVKALSANAIHRVLSLCKYSIRSTNSAYLLLRTIAYHESVRNFKEREGRRSERDHDVRCP